MSKLEFKVNDWITFKFYLKKYILIIQRKRNGFEKRSL